MADQSTDEAEIIELIHRNRIAIWTCDYDAWAECFVHAPYLTRWGWWRTGGIFLRQGFDELYERVKRSGPPRRDDFAHETKLENLMIRIGDDMAWATFDQRYPGDYKAGVAGPGLLREVRFFERHDGRWKIAFFGMLDGNAGPPSTATARLDVEGRVLWKSPAFEALLADADDLVIRGGRLRFRDSRIDRRLQDAIQLVAARDGGYMSTQVASPIVVDAGDDQPARIYWVAMDAGMVIFSLGKSRVSEERLELAAAIYGLSAAQKQVAALVAEGLSLTEAATRMSVSVHTARTHLQRIFDKTGVRNQTALVRVLLSAVAPI